MRKNLLEESQIRIIEKQLGRKPRGVLSVPERCRFGYPLILKTKPVLIEEQGFEIFPTLFWLSCPIRSEEVARIESEGYIEKLEEELNSNQALKEKYLFQQQDYLDEQWGLLTGQERKFLEDKGLGEGLKKGIGGIESDSHIKCLHLHLAHEIAEENVIGKLLKGRFELTDCSPGGIYCKGGTE